jgi:hypothetical protein
LELQATKARRETGDLSIDDATESSDDGDDNEDKQPPTNDPVSPRVLRAMKKIGGWFNQKLRTPSAKLHEIARFSLGTPATLIPTNNQEGILKMTLEMY